MKRLGKNNPVRWTFVGLLLLVFVLSACSTGNSPSETPSANPAENTTDTGNTTPAENISENQPVEEAPAEEQPTDEPAAGEGISFSADVLPIFESRCMQCHGGERTEGELNLLTYAQVMAGGKDGAVVIPGDADASLLAQLIIEQKMPKRGPKLTPAQTQIIIDWINQGALDN